MNWEQQVEKRLAMLEHRAEAAIRVGVVSAVQAEPYRVAVRLGPDAVTAMLPVWAPARSAWLPLQVGDPVPVLSAGGEDVLRFVLGGVVAPRPVHTDAPPWDGCGPVLDAVQLSATEDSRLRLEAEKSVLRLNADTYVELTGGMVKVHGDLTVTGSVEVQGQSVEHQGTNVGRTHRHYGKPPTLPTDFTGGPV